MKKLLIYVITTCWITSCATQQVPQLVTVFPTITPCPDLGKSTGKTLSQEMANDYLQYRLCQLQTQGMIDYINDLERGN